ncbi:MAG TPA: RagB/SusD family nutrient uptake outer membrane protein [Longimicrobiales bacterium]|nr:RagB/SusD family nutrient uptake outer membrane protein [Longimicrobiales bacterium]
MTRTLRAILVIPVVAVLLAGCDDPFMDRFPEDRPSTQTYFKTKDELATYVYGLYSYLPGSDVYTGDFQSDNVEQKNYNRVVAGQQAVETDAGAAGWTWDYLRRVNVFLENYQRADVPPEVAAHYAGVARFFRAWFYFDKVKRFGDVPWYSGTLQPGDSALYKGRDPRTLVMDSVLADLNYAGEHVNVSAAPGEINRWAALALKARVALHEGTYRRYHGLDGADRFLQEAADAAKRVIDGGVYRIYGTGHADTDYRDLFLASGATGGEVILAHAYSTTLDLRHPANGTFITGTLGAPGLTRSLVDTYLTKDGKPFTDVPGHDTLSFYSETRNRDPRLAQTMRTPGYTRIGGTTQLVPDFDVSRTGYQPIKFVASTAYDTYNTNDNHIPVLRFGEVLLDFAEARAELGQLTQGDLDLTINRLRDRVGMPHMDLGSLSADPVLAAQYPNVTGAQRAAILEIRRERRVELAMEGRRYDDLMRWKAGALLVRPFDGMYFPGKGEFDLDHNGTVDVAIVDAVPAQKKSGVQYLVLGDAFVLSQGDRGRVRPHPDLVKVFDESKHYLWPLPLTELLLNKQLVQNPGW